jgi:hypothetical protein
MGENANRSYAPRRPENTVLHRVLTKNIEAFRRDVHERGKILPAYVESELQAYLDCGNPEKGFARLKCSDCAHERILAFSCKRRGFCPSCCGRRMTEAEMQIVGDIFPHQSARQWVLSLPMPLRFLCARNRALLGKLAQIFCRGVEHAIRKNLRRRGASGARSGGILFIQRLGGALNLNVHFHTIFLDGGYTLGPSGPEFHDLGAGLTTADVADAVMKIAMKSVRMLKVAGLLDDGVATDDTDADGIDLCDSASIKNRIAFGERAGQVVRRIRLNLEQKEPRIRGELVAEMHGFNLKADKVVKAHQRWKLARLVRYVARPPVANDRLLLAEDGETVRYVMKNPWSDGTVEIQLSGVELVEKMAAAVPPPRGHLTRYLGVLAPNSGLRSSIVPVPKPKARAHGAQAADQLTKAQRLSWARLAMHAFQVDLNKCELCGGQVRRLAVITGPFSAARFLRCMGRPRPPPEVQGSRRLEVH